MMSRYQRLETGLGQLDQMFETDTSIQELPELRSYLEKLAQLTRERRAIVANALSDSELHRQERIIDQRPCDSYESCK